jgi:hypothetical protein
MKKKLPSCHASDREEPLTVLIGLCSSKSLLLSKNISEYVVVNISMEFASNLDDSKGK